MTERRWPAALPRTLSNRLCVRVIIYKCKDGLLAFGVVLFEELEFTSTHFSFVFIESIRYESAVEIFGLLPV